MKKYKEKAELNISVTKLNSEEIEGFIAPEQNKIYFSLDNTKYGIQPGYRIYVSEELQEVPSISTTNGRRKINGMLNQKVLKDGDLEYTVTNKNNTTEIEINYSKIPKEIYIGILNNQYNIKKIFKGVNNGITYSARAIYVEGTIDLGTAYLDIELTKDYNGEYIERIRGGLENPVYGTNSGRGIKILGYTKFNNGQGPLPYRGEGDDMATAVMYSALGKQEINGVVFFEAQKIGEPSEHYYEYETNHNNNFMSGTLKVDDELTVALASHNHGDELSVAILKYPKRNFNIEISYYGMLLREEDYYRNKVVFKTIIRAKYKIEKIVGQSLLEVKEHYPSPEFIAFNSCSLEQQKDIALENALRDVKITQTSGKDYLR